MPDPHQPDDEQSPDPGGAAQETSTGHETQPGSGSGASGNGADPVGDDRPTGTDDPGQQDEANGVAAGESGEEPTDKARKVRREEAREAADAERAAREHQAQVEALELARADAERMLAGPGLVTPDPRIPAAELEDQWGAAALTALAEVRADLDGHRVGLAISGGGALGSFEAGVLRFAYDHLRIDPVAICGNSAGALNAAKLAEGRHSDRSPIDEVERLWRSMRINSDMWEPEPWLVRLYASASWAAALREQVGDADGATGAVRVAVRVVGSLVRRPPETDGTIDAVREAIRAQSLLTLAPVEALVERELNPRRIRESGIALRVGTVSLEAGKLRYITETGELRDRHDQPIGQPDVDLARGVVASASIPMAFPPVELNGEHYVDGGAREILPLELLATRMGADRVIAVSASSATIKPAASFAERNMIDILRRVSAEIAPNETLRKELNPPGGWDPHVRLVVPEFDVHDSMTIDPALIAISVDHGYLRAADVLLSLGEDAAALTEEITRLRIRLRHLAGPVPTFFDTALGRDRRERLEGKVPADQDSIEVEVITDHAGQDGHDGKDGKDDDPLAAVEGVVRSARSRTATTVAKLVKVIGRDHDELDDDDRLDEAVVAADDGDVEGEVEHARTTPHTVRVEVGVADDDGADVAVRQVDGAVEVLIAPQALRTGDEVVGDDDGADRHDEAIPDLDADQHDDEEAERARRAEVREVTSELRALVRRRHDLGLPLPQTLHAWLLAGPDPHEVQEALADELHPVGGAAVGGQQP